MPSALRPLQLRSNSAHCVRKLAKSLAKRRVGKAEVSIEVEAEVVEEKEDDEEEEKEKNNSDKI